MQRLALRTQRQQGITLIESLIALIIAALGILGIIGVQMRTLTDTSSTVRRAQAIRLIEDLSERLKVNPNAIAVLGSYTTSFSNTPTQPSCGTGSSGCDRTGQAENDIYLWKQGVKALPMGAAQVFIPPAEAGLDATERRQLGVLIAWRENESADLSADDKKNTDATQVRDADGNLQSTATCPTGYTCHLQYIPVSARCAPYKAGSGPLQYFCAGA